MTTPSSLPAPSRPLPLDDASAGAIVDAMVPLAGIPMAPEWRGTVITAVQATAAGAAIAASGILRDAGSALAVSGRLGEAMSEASTGYLVVYHIEIGLLFATLVAIGPLVRRPAPPPLSARPALS